jgi:hypothetical protein
VRLHGFLPRATPLSSGQAISLFGNSLKQPTIFRRVQLTGLGDADATQNPVKRTAPEPIIIVDAQPLSHNRARFALTRHTNQFWHESSIARLRYHNAALTTRFDMAARRPVHGVRPCILNQRGAGSLGNSATTVEFEP